MSDIKERLRKIAVIFKGDDLPSTGAMLVEAADHIATLEQESAANLQRALVAEKDAARYRFLRNFKNRVDFYSNDPNWTVAVEQHGIGSIYKGERLDGEIDKARAPDTSTQEVG